MKPGTGVFNTTRTTYVLAGVMESTGRMMAALPPTFPYRSIEALTSCAVISCPLWKRTPCRNVNV